MSQPERIQIGDREILVRQAMLNAAGKIYYEVSDGGTVKNLSPAELADLRTQAGTVAPNRAAPVNGALPRQPQTTVTVTPVAPGGAPLNLPARAGNFAVVIART